MGNILSRRVGYMPPAGSSADDNWPECDDDGFYQSYKEWKIWVNWWSRGSPSYFWSIYTLLFESSRARIPEPAILEQTLPVKTPYWVKSDKLAGESGVRVTWLGHATVLAEVDRAVILCDPIFSDRCSPVQFMGTKRYRPPACTVQQLPENLDVVLISHTHYDHLDRNSVADIHRRYPGIFWCVPRGSESWFRSMGIPEDRVIGMTWWQSMRLPIKGAELVFTPSNHWSGRWGFDKNWSLWGSWTVIGKNGGKFWFGGDTAYCDAFSQIGRRFGGFDLAAIPIGAYSPRQVLGFNHVSPEEAVQIHKDIGSRRSMGIHWGTFQMVCSNEPYLEPKEIIEQIVEGTGFDTTGQRVINFDVVHIGETVEAA